MSRTHTVLGSGITATACALFAARHGPVRLCGRPDPAPARSVENVPAATLTLLLELGITPVELDVHRLVRGRWVAWERAEPEHRTGPACAHLDRSALRAALWERAVAHPAVTVGGRAGVVPGTDAGRIVDATGGRAVTAPAVERPPRPWVAATVTLPSVTLPPGTMTSGATDAGLRLAAASDGYAYRLGSARWTTLGWVGPGRPPRDAGALWRRIERAGAGWLLTGAATSADAPTHRRPAGLALPVAAPGVVPIGDAALTRDALASQGTSIGLSDACLAADPATPAAALAARRADGVRRHLHHLDEMAAACRFADAPAWSEYRGWLAGAVARIAVHGHERRPVGASRE